MGRHIFKGATTIFGIIGGAFNGGTDLLPFIVDNICGGFIAITLVYPGIFSFSTTVVYGGLVYNVRCVENQAMVLLWAGNFNIDVFVLGVWGVFGNNTTRAMGALIIITGGAGIIFDTNWGTCGRVLHIIYILVFIGACMARFVLVVFWGVIVFTWRLCNISCRVIGVRYINVGGSLLVVFVGFDGGFNTGVVAHNFNVLEQLWGLILYKKGGQWHVLCKRGFVIGFILFCSVLCGALLIFNVMGYGI